MVDPIGFRPPGAIARRTGAVGSAEPVAAARDATRGNGQAAQTPVVEPLSRAMASEPPVDSDRVAKIKRAIENGTFPLVPSTIADRLLALRMDWNPNEPS